MHEEDFLETVRQGASLDSTEQARTVTEATLRTLGERITDGEADDLARNLPPEFATALTDASPGEADPFSLEEFVERVSGRAEIDDSLVVEYSRGVAAALAEGADTELETAREQLPPEFDVIFVPGGPTTVNEFLEAVRDRGDLDSTDAASDATTAMLRTLGERLSGGKAADLALYLPEQFGEELVETGDEEIADYSLDEFVRRVSQREGVEKERARRHARAVGSTLGDAASVHEIDAAKKQLPDPFGTIFDPPSTTDKDN